MYNVKGFIINENLLSNAPNQVAEFGELSTKAMTYSRDKGFYKDDNNDFVRFVSFKSKDNSDNSTALPATITNHILAMGKYLYTRFNAANITNSIPTLINDIQTEFNSATLNLTNISINQLISSTGNSAKRLPDYLQWTATDTTSGTVEFTTTVWFSDTYFRSQYDEYELLLIAPLPVIDNFYQTNAAVGTALAAVTPKSITTKIDQLAGDDPYTDILVLTTQWQEHSNFGTNTRSVDWYFVSYGVAGSNPDYQNQMIQDYLSNPTNTQLNISYWQEMFPGVFETSEYYIVPFWNRIITNIPTALYSPTVKVGKAVATTQQNVPFTASTQWWNDYLCVTNTIYQCLTINVIGSPTNTSNNDFDFTIKYPDYINVSLSDPDAARMSQSTQGFVSFLTTMLQYAQILTSTTSQNQLPVGYSKITRGGKLFLTSVYEGTRYFAMSKVSYTAVN